MAFGIMNEFQKEKFKQTNEVDLAYGVPGLGRFRVNVFQQRGTIGVVLRVIPFKIQTIEQLMLPKVLEKIAGRAARPRPRHRHHRLRQVDDARGDDRSHQRDRDLPHHDDRGSDRVPHPRQAVDREPARGRRRHDELRPGAEERAAPGPRRHPGRRDARPRDHRDGAHRRRDRPPRHVDAPHARRDRDHQPHHLRVPALPAEAGPAAARLGAARPSSASGSCRAPTARAASRRSRCSSRPARVRELIEDKDRTKEIPDAIAQGHVSYGMQTFDQSLMSLLKAGPHHLRGGAPPGDEPRRLRAARLRHLGHERLEVGRLREAAEPRRAARRGPSAGRGPPPRPRRRGAPRPARPRSRRPSRRAPRASARPRPRGDDDFQIERF